MKKELFFRHKKFVTITNLEVIELLNEIHSIKTEYHTKLKEKMDILEQIQKDCNHEYLLSSIGMHEDSYVCPLCGKEKDY
jgi:hypothetical protein